MDIEKLNNTIKKIIKKYKCTKNCCAPRIGSGKKKYPILSFINLERGCGPRATYLAYMLHRFYSIDCNKITIRGYNLRPPNLNYVSWYEHVANYIEINGEGYVIDLSLDPPIVPALKWIESIAPDGCSAFPDERLSKYIYCIVHNWQKNLSDPRDYRYFLSNPSANIEKETGDLFSKNFTLNPVARNEDLFFDIIIDTNCQDDTYTRPVQQKPGK